MPNVNFNFDYKVIQEKTQGFICFSEIRIIASTYGDYLSALIGEVRIKKVMEGALIKIVDGCVWVEVKSLFPLSKGF